MVIAGQRLALSVLARSNAEEMTLSDQIADRAAGRAKQPSGRLFDAQGQEIEPHARSGTNELIEAIRRQPVSAALIALGIGYLAGKVF